jgi:hypothetical protein
MDFTLVLISSMTSFIKFRRHHIIYLFFLLWFSLWEYLHVSWCYHVTNFSNYLKKPQYTLWYSTRNQIFKTWKWTTGTLKIAFSPGSCEFWCFNPYF